MLRNTLWVIFFGLFGLIVSGCASNTRMESSDVSSPPAGGDVAMSSPSTSDAALTDSSSMNRAAPSQPTSNSSQSRIAAGIDEETLDTCLARIPEDATTGQKMLAEQTCRRNFSSRR